MRENYITLKIDFETIFLLKTQNRNPIKIFKEIKSKRGKADYNFPNRYQYFIYCKI